MSKIGLKLFITVFFVCLALPVFAAPPVKITPAEAQEIYENGFKLVVSCYLIGLGIGLVIKILKSAYEH